MTHTRHFDGLKWPTDEREAAASESAAKDQGEGEGPCQDCGGRNIVWHAPHELWDSVMDCEPGVSTGGIVCPTCFVKRAYAKGLTDCVWYLCPKPHGMDPKVPLEGRVTPTYHYFTGPPVELLKQWYARFLNPSGQWASWPPEG